MKNYPKNPSSNEMFKLAKEAGGISKDRRKAKKSQEDLRFAKGIALLATVAIGGPFAAHAADRAISQPQEQSAKNAEKIINANPAVANTLDTFKTNDGQTVTVKTK